MGIVCISRRFIGLNLKRDHLLIVLMNLCYSAILRTSYQEEQMLTFYPHGRLTQRSILYLSKMARDFLAIPATYLGFFWTPVLFWKTFNIWQEMPPRANYNWSLPMSQVLAIKWVIKYLPNIGQIFGRFGFGQILKIKIWIWCFQSFDRYLVVWLGFVRSPNSNSWFLSKIQERGLLLWMKLWRKRQKPK